eukprot:INCI17796.1.p1 GENE.INCI17796.1~~INCI17796.1.p1  ORF type:complete len:140 (+),score=28.06 INCI17796.1:68-487(+)
MIEIVLFAFLSCDTEDAKKKIALFLHAASQMPSETTEVINPSHNDPSARLPASWLQEPRVSLKIMEMLVGQPLSAHTQNHAGEPKRIASCVCLAGTNAASTEAKQGHEELLLQQRGTSASTSKGNATCKSFGKAIENFL